MMRRTVQVLPRREAWHGLQEFTQTDQAATAFRNTRAMDNHVVATIKDAEDKKIPAIDWAHWESTIAHTDLVHNLRDFHDEQMRVLDSALAEDHKEKVLSQTQGWDLFEDAVKSCEKSVEKSEEIVRNGARALWVSYNNPPISQVSTSEWLDVDQYWQAFVEKHHYYHNHLLSVVEDPESKEYDQKQEQDLLKKWNMFDGKSVDRFNNQHLYQRPSYEYYELFRGPLVEHMIFYLTKSGGDARFFPELMPHKWFCSIYDIRFNLYNVLQRRRRAKQIETLARQTPHDYHPADLDHDGETYYARLLQEHNELVENQTARLMGNFILFTEHVPIQTASALYRTLEEQGTYYALGNDVNALFFKPKEGYKTADPVDSFNTLADHLVMKGARLPVGYMGALNAFCQTLQTRKEGLGGAWFNLEGESPREAFMRRLKKDDPAYAVYQEYSDEFVQRWKNAEEVTKEKAIEMIDEIERLYKLECEEFDNMYLKKDIDTVTTLHEADGLASRLSAGWVNASGSHNADEIIESMKAARVE